MLELNICFKLGNCLRSCFDIVGPMPGKPSRINCFCSWIDFIVFDGLSDRDVDFVLVCFSYFLAVRIRNFEVSSSFSVKIIGTWKSNATDKSIPLIAFSWMFVFSCL